MKPTVSFRKLAFVGALVISVGLPGVNVRFQDGGQGVRLLFVPVLNGLVVLSAILMLISLLKDRHDASEKTFERASLCCSLFAFFGALVLIETVGHLIPHIRIVGTPWRIVLAASPGPGLWIGVVATVAAGLPTVHSPIHRSNLSKSWTVWHGVAGLGAIGCLGLRDSFWYSARVSDAAVPLRGSDLVGVGWLTGLTGLLMASLVAVLWLRPRLMPAVALVIVAWVYTLIVALVVLVGRFVSMGVESLPEFDGADVGVVRVVGYAPYLAWAFGIAVLAAALRLAEDSPREADLTLNICT